MDKLAPSSAEIPSCPTAIPLSQSSTLWDGKQQTDSDTVGDALPSLAYFASTGDGAYNKTPSKLDLFRSHDYTIVFVSAFGLFHQYFACTLYTPVIPYRLQSIGVTNVEASTGYLGSVWAAGCIIGSLFAAWLPTVHKNRRTQLLAYNVVLFAAGLFFAFMSSFAGLMLGRLLHGFGSSGLWCMTVATLTDNVDPTRVGRLVGIAQIGNSMGNTLSPTLGGILYGKLGWKALCYFALAIAVVNAALLCLYLEKKDLSKDLSAPQRSLVDENAVEETSQAPKSMAARLKLVVTDMKYCSAFVVAIVWGATVASLLNTALTLRLKDRYHTSATAVGYTFLAIAGPNTVLSPLAGYLTDRLGARPLSMGCLGGFALLSGVLCIDALPYAGLLVVMVGIGACASFMNTPAMVHLAKVDRVYGGPVGSSLICGIWSTVQSIAYLVFPLLAGGILDKVGTSLGWKILLGLHGACFLACLAFVARSMVEPSTSPLLSQPAADIGLKQDDVPEKMV